MRQIVLDTETTGLDHTLGHRIVEIGCVELIHRRPTGNDFHRYVNPGRRVGDSVDIHGISDDFLADKPPFRAIAEELWGYLEGAELIIHNAAFDVGFLDNEFGLCGLPKRLAEACEITDTAMMARKRHPGQKVNLDALCSRYGVDNSRRDLHGALLDARLLADVYLAMTGKQWTLSLDGLSGVGGGGSAGPRFAELLGVLDAPLRVIEPDAGEMDRHQARLAAIDRKSGGKLLWKADLPSPTIAADGAIR